MDDYIKQFFNECISLREMKAKDYASEQDTFKNFTIQKTIGLSAQKAILSRLLDKIARVDNLEYKAPTVTDETFRDTCLDGAVYFALLAMLHDQEK